MLNSRMIKKLNLLSLAICIFFSSYLFNLEGSLCSNLYRYSLSQGISHFSYFAHNATHLLVSGGHGDIFLGHNFSGDKNKFFKLCRVTVSTTVGTEVTDKLGKVDKTSKTLESFFNVYLSKVLLSTSPAGGVAIHYNEKKDDKLQKKLDIASLALGPVVGAAMHKALSSLVLKDGLRGNYHALMHLLDLALVLPKNSSGQFPKVLGVEIATDGSQILSKLNLRGYKKALACLLPGCLWLIAAKKLLLPNGFDDEAKKVLIIFLTETLLPAIVNFLYATH